MGSEVQELEVGAVQEGHKREETAWEERKKMCYVEGSLTTEVVLSRVGICNKYKVGS